MIFYFSELLLQSLASFQLESFHFNSSAPASSKRTPNGERVSGHTNKHPHWLNGNKNAWICLESCAFQFFLVLKQWLNSLENKLSYPCDSWPILSLDVLFLLVNFFGKRGQLFPSQPFWVNDVFFIRFPINYEIFALTKAWFGIRLIQFH